MAAHAPSSGWLPDPDDPSRQRFWTGQTWSDDVATRSATTPRPAPERAADVRHFLDEMHRVGMLSDDLRRRIDGLVDAWARRRAQEAAWVLSKQPLRVAAPPAETPAEIPAETPAARPVPVPPVPAPSRPTPRPEPSWSEAGTPPETVARPVTSLQARRHARTSPTEPAGTQQSVETTAAATPTWAERTRRALASDLGVHGLAYLGVLLLLAGVTGFVVFAFSELTSAMRPIAEVMVPAALLAAGWALSRRGASIASRALTMGGAALVPVVAIAAFVDGAAVPTDLTDAALAWTATAVTAAIALLYAVLATRREHSTLAYLAAPIAWMSVGLAALALTDPTVAGRDIAAIHPMQVAAMTSALAVTAILARLVPGHRLARPTSTSSIIGLCVMAILVVATADQDWSWAAIATAALATGLALEGLAERLPILVVRLGQPVALGLAIGACAEPWGTAWSAAVGVVAFLLLLEWQARQGLGDHAPLVLVVTGLGAVVASAITLVPLGWPTIVGFGCGSLWAHLRRWRGRDWLPADLVTVAAAVLPVGVAAGLFGVLDPTAAAVSIAAAVSVLVVTVRLTGHADDPFARWWLPSVVTLAAAVPVVTGIADAAATPSGWLAVAAALLVPATLAMPGSVALRIWASAVVVVEAATLAVLSLEIDPTVAAVAAAAIALLAVVSAVRRWPVLAHVGAIGHLLAVGALVLVLVDGRWSFAGAAFTAVLTMMVAGWAVTWLRDEFASSTVCELVDTWVGGRVAGWVLAVGTALGLAAVTVSAVDTIVGLDVGPDGALPVAAVLVASVGWLEALTSRLLTRHERAGLVAAAVGLGLTVIGLGMSGDAPWTIVVSSALVGTAAVVTAPRWWGVWTPWVVWASTVPFVTQLVVLVGAPTSRWTITIFLWGTVLAVGAFAADAAIEGRRAAAGFVRHRWFLPAAVLGLALAPIGLDASWGTESVTVASTLTVIAAVAVFAICWFARTGVLTVAAWMLVTVGIGGLVPFDVLDHPWTLVAWSTLPLAAALVVAGAGLDRQAVWDRWDLAALVGSVIVLVTGVVAAPVADSILVTWLPAAAIVAFIGLWRDEDVWLVAAVVLANGAAADAGTGWLAGSLALTSAGATVLATRRVGATRWVLQGTGALAGGGAVVALIEALALSADARVALVAIGSGVLLLGLATAIRADAIRHDWLASWGLLGVIGLTEAAIAVGDADRLRGGSFLAVGLALVALAAALLAEPLGQPRCRDAAVLIAALGGGALWWATEPSPTVVVVIAIAMSVLATAAAMTTRHVAPVSPWVVPLAEAAIVTTVAALSAAMSALPDRSLLALSLAVTGTNAIAVGLVLRTLALQLIGPPMLCAAWLLITADAMAGEVVWLATPVGLTMLAVVGLARRHVAELGGHGTPDAAVAVEWLGMGMLVVPAAGEVLTGRVAFSILLITTGVLIAGWGMFSEVRRRLYAGVATMVLAVVLLIGVPLAELAASADYGPTSGSAAFWLSIAGLGVVAILAAIFLEQGRNKVREVRTRLEELTSGWE